MMAIHVFGPFFIHGYGVCIAAAVLLFWYCLKKDLRVQRLVTNDQLTNLLSLGIISGIIGGRVLFLFIHPHYFSDLYACFSPCVGGFSILGTIIAIIISCSWYIYKQNIPLLALADRVSLYAPLLQALARIGCLCADCCGGVNITFPPLKKLVSFCFFEMNHPTPLYSTLLLLILFFLLRFLESRSRYITGFLFVCYLIGSSCERFFVDFLRNDRIYFSTITVFSYYQLVALIIIFCALMLYTFIIWQKRYESV